VSDFSDIGMNPVDPRSAPDRRRVVLGVGGGIAAYKACELVRRLRDAGADVHVVPTAAATRFVGAPTFQALSGRPVRDGLWDEAAEAAMGHIELARWAQWIVIAPATADLIARLAHGLADDLLTTLCLASAAPLAIAPAMNRQMWAHPAVQANLAVLRDRGARILGPAEGDQACGDVGPGRLLEPDRIVAALFDESPTPATRAGALAGLRMVVSAGPTFEDIDPVRYLGNRSSGRMGFAVAEAAHAQGADVVLVAGPTALATPPGVRRIDVRSALEMRDAVLGQMPGSAIFVGAAAVADYRPRSVAAGKIAKSGDDDLRLELVQNPDIVAEVAALPQRPFVAGFAAETDDVEARALATLERKRLDLIAANRVGGGHGFDASDNALVLYWRDGREDLGRADKRVLADRFVARIAANFRDRGNAA
jgi:phosphopantothenoylcysteine decarboxylase/phosphopantothenate--cysteine ligase